MYQWSALQIHVSSLMNDELDRQNAMGGRAGVKQMLERKEGVFRMNMMGKRVNFGARSVITPDPNLMLHEIGLPEVFARGLTVPEPVTERNYFDMHQAVINGPNSYPG